jgi:chromosome segregation ATPase
MANQIDEQTAILNLQVNYADAINGITEYTKRMNELQAQMKYLADQYEKGKISENEYRKEMEAVRAVSTQYKDNVRVLRKELQNNVRQQQENEGSLKQLRAELSNATKAYDELSRAERNGAKGKEMRNHINEITKELKQAEGETERFYRNVGNYENSIVQALGGNNKFAQSLLAMRNNAGGISGVVTQATTSVRAFGSALLSLLANPVFLAFAGIAGTGVAFKWFYD